MDLAHQLDYHTLIAENAGCVDWNEVVRADVDAALAREHRITSASLWRAGAVASITTAFASCLVGVTTDLDLPALATYGISMAGMLGMAARAESTEKSAKVFWSRGRKVNRVKVHVMPVASLSLTHEVDDNTAQAVAYVWKNGSKVNCFELGKDAEPIAERYLLLEEACRTFNEEQTLQRSQALAENNLDGQGRFVNLPLARQQAEHVREQLALQQAEQKANELAVSSEACANARLLDVLASQR